MAGGWAGLPSELVESISERITMYTDYLRLRSVCPEWRASVPKTPFHLPPQFPFLILSPSTFFDISTTKTHHLPFNLPPSRIYGSSHGWLITHDETSKVCLLNPFTGASISLPDVDTFNIIQKIFLRSPRGIRGLQIRRNPYRSKKIMLSCSPSKNDNFVAFALVGKTILAYCKNGFDSWDLVYGKFYPWEDIVHHQEKGLFYAVSKRGTVVVSDVESSTQPQVQFFKAVMPWKLSCDIGYAVFSGDDLLLVSRAVNQDAGGEPNQVCRTVGFEVLKMDWSGLKWDKVETLGDKVLFVGGNSSLSFSSSDFGGCFEADCIYFTGRCARFHHEDACGKRDTGKFRLRDKRIEALPCQFGSCLPIWLTPNPY